MHSLLCQSGDLVWVWGKWAGPRGRGAPGSASARPRPQPPCPPGPSTAVPGCLQTRWTPRGSAGMGSAGPDPALNSPLRFHFSFFLSSFSPLGLVLAPCYKEKFRIKTVGQFLKLRFLMWFKLQGYIVKFWGQERLWWESNKSFLTEICRKKGRNIYMCWCKTHFFLHPITTTVDMINLIRSKMIQTPPCLPQNPTFK